MSSTTSGQFRRKLVLNPENDRYYLPFYVRESLMKEPVNWFVHPFEFHHRLHPTGKWILREEARTQNSSGYSLYSNTLPPTLVLMYVCYISVPPFRPKSDRIMIIGSFIVHRKTPIKASTKELEDKAADFTKFIDQIIESNAPVVVTGKSLVQAIFPTGIDFTNFIEMFLDKVVPLQPDYLFHALENRTTKDYSELRSFLMTCESPDVNHGLVPARKYLESREYKGSPTSAISYMGKLVEEEELLQLCTTVSSDTIEILGMDKSQILLPTTKESLTSDSSTPDFELDLESFFDIPIEIVK